MSIIPSLDSEAISTSVLVIILVVFTALAGGAVLFLMRRGSDKDYLDDRFGFD